MNNDKLITKNYRIKIKPDFPLADLWSLNIIAFRLIDVKSPGIIYYAIPDLMKEPMPLTFRYNNKEETVSTKAGIFRTRMLITTWADPFIGKLLEPLLKNSTTLIEDSARRLFVKFDMTGTEALLEEISNVIKPQK